MQERIVSLAFDVVSNILETGPVSSSPRNILISEFVIRFLVVV